MTAETRSRIFRYGIAVDLVILATGFGLLYPSVPALILTVFVGAVALSAWKGGWSGAVTAIGSGVVLLLLFFPDQFGFSHLLTFVALSAAAALIVRMAVSAPRAGVLAVAGAPAAFHRMPVIDREELARQSRQRHELAHALERAAVRQLEEQRERLRRSSEVVIPSVSEGSGGEAVATVLPPAPPDSSLTLGMTGVGQQAAERLSQARVAIEDEFEERLAREATILRQKAEEKFERRFAKEAAAIEARAEARYRKRLTAERRRIKRAVETEAAEEARPPSDAERDFDERLAAERVSIEAALQARYAQEIEAAREAADRRLSEELEAEQRAAQLALEERVAVERRLLQQQLEENLERERELTREQMLAREREDLGRRNDEALDQARQQEQRAAEEALQRKLDELRREIQDKTEQRLAQARAALEREAAERVAAPAPRPTAAPPKVAAPGFLTKITSLLHRPATGRLNFTKKKTAPKPIISPRRPVPASPRKPVARLERKPRLLLLERRRGTADTVAPKLRQRGVEVGIVERWIDAVDEIFRFKPDALLIDSDLPDFSRILKTIHEQRSNLPTFVTGRPQAPPSSEIAHAGFVARPYDVEELIELARMALTSPEQLLAEQAMRSAPAVTKPAAARPVIYSTPPAAAPPAVALAPQPVVAETLAPAIPLPAPEVLPPEPATRLEPVADSSERESYRVTCFNCRTVFDATDCEWCGCLTKERTLVCTNCLSCFCKAPPSYKEKFWVEAPPRLFERKTAEARRHQVALSENPAPDQVKRPLVLAVEDDEDIQMIIQRVCTNLGYGFIYATNGQDGLTAARDYRPELILSDAFMPKLDGREMCRMLKEEPAGADCKMVVMTGLYTDTKYRSEALKRFHVDDYIAKPVAVTELVNLLQKHLEGTTGLPVQEDLHARYRSEIEQQEEDGVPLADILDRASPDQSENSAPGQERRHSYDICCYNCNEVFDSTRADWCTCVGREQTLVCSHCNSCFCKAPSVYKERFWMDAPPSLFERKMIGSKRNISSGTNPLPSEVRRPLILLVEDDENIQLIVRTVVTTMGFGFIVGANGQEGLSLAREYKPDLILSDAFMPKLDGREMCRLLKEDPVTARVKAIIMTGLYTDRKYRNEALDYFKVDDYVAKPVAVDDLIRLFKKHLPQDVQPTM